MRCMPMLRTSDNFGYTVLKTKKQKRKDIKRKPKQTNRYQQTSYTQNVQQRMRFQSIINQNNISLVNLLN